MVKTTSICRRKCEAGPSQSGWYRNRKLDNFGYRSCHTFSLPFSRIATKGFTFITGKVKIGHACFIGANSVICKNISIGDNSIVGAGSIVTKDIPDNEIWGAILQNSSKT